MRDYTKVDMIRFLRFAEENPEMKPIELLKAYDEAYPEKTAKEKLINLRKAIFSKK